MWFSKEPLKPGTCECGHIRSNHRRGRSKCAAMFILVGGGESKSYQCACQLFIEDVPELTNQDVEIAALKKMAGLS